MKITKLVSKNVTCGERYEVVSSVLVTEDKEFGWKRPFYINLVGSLMACKIERLEYDLNSQKPVLLVKTAAGDSFRAEIHGEDGFILYVIKPVYRDNEKILNDGYYSMFDSVESYKKTKFACIKFVETSLADIINFCGVLFDVEEVDERTESFVRYWWDGTKVKTAYLTIDNLTFDAVSGFTADIDVQGTSYVNTYLSKETCLSDNSINVIDFEDDNDEIFVERKITIELNSKKAEYKKLLELLKEYFSDNVGKASIKIYDYEM